MSNSWQIERLCLLGYYVIPLSIHMEIDEPSFFLYYRGNKSMLAGYQGTW